MQQCFLRGGIESVGEKTDGKGGKAKGKQAGLHSRVARMGGSHRRWLHIIGRSSSRRRRGGTGLSCRDESRAVYRGRWIVSRL